MNVLEKRLVEISEDSRSKGDEIVEDVKLLLAGTAAEERNTLRAIGLDADLNVAEKKLEEQIIRNTNGRKLGKVIIIGADIKKMCVDYRLYMKPAKEYIGTIPPTLGAELTRFCKEKNIVLTSSSDYSRFFIIAPPKMFKNYLSPLNVYRRANKEQIAEDAERERLRKLDPILVYKLDQPGYYAIIKSWGDDFSPIRRAYGFITQRAHIEFFNILQNSILFWLAIYLLYKVNYTLIMHYVNKPVPVFPWWAIIGGFVSLILFVPTMIWCMGESETKVRRRMMETITDYERLAKY